MKQKPKTIKDLTDRELQEDILVYLQRIRRSVSNTAIVLTTFLVFFLIWLFFDLAGSIL